MADGISVGNARPTSYELRSQLRGPRPRRLRILVFSAFAVIGSFLFAVPAAHGVDLRTVAMSGGPAPGTGGRNFFAVVPSAFNGAGQVAIRAELCCPEQSSTGRWGIWSEGAGPLALVARSGSAASGISSGTFVENGFGNPSLNNSGRLAFVAIVRAPAITTDPFHAMYSNRNGSLSLITRSFLPAPGTGAGINFLGFDAFTTGAMLNDSGKIAFRGGLTGTGVDTSNDLGIWTESAGAMSLVARTGSPAPDTPVGTAFKSLDAPTMNNAGRVLFTAYLTGSGIDATNEIGVWSADDTGVHKVARIGDAVPQASVGSVYTSLSLPLQNDSGQMVFRGSMTGPGIDDSNNDRIWLKSNTAFQAIAQEGDRAPGTPDGVVFSQPFFQPTINQLGQVFFYSRLAGPGVNSRNSAGVWMFADGGLKLVARNGDHAPGFPPDGVFAGIVAGPQNDLGQFAFRASVVTQGDGASIASNSIWTWRPNDAPRLLLRSGSVIDVNNHPSISDPRSLTQIVGPLGLTNSGQLLTQLGFSDFSFGVFVLNLPPVPEPSSATLGAIAVVLLLRRQSTR